MRRSPDAVLKKLAKILVNDVCISVITKSELLVGVEVSPKRRQDETALDAFFATLRSSIFPTRHLLHYAKIRADLKARGAMIGANDLLIAAHARSLGLTLITNNTREFRRVRNLSLDNWTTGA